MDDVRHREEFLACAVNDEIKKAQIGFIDSERSVDGTSCVGKTTLLKLFENVRAPIKINRDRPDITSGSDYNLIPFLSVAYAVNSRTPTTTIGGDPYYDRVVSDRSEFSNLIYQIVHEIMDEINDLPEREWDTAAMNLLSRIYERDNVSKIVAVLTVPEKKYLIVIDSDLDGLASRMRARCRGNDTINSFNRSYLYAQNEAFRFLHHCLPDEKAAIFDLAFADSVTDMHRAVESAIFKDDGGINRPRKIRKWSRGDDNDDSNCERVAASFPRCEDSIKLVHFKRQHYNNETVRFRFSKK
ncbi:hypothetical protein QAD02_001471 [Eretmocerus hayati]|uniref:Uncharacterized protein n=1 Tax=Eretmocerus hayati TaxID=131215 RepID=A0ACC2NIZ6_9HYME|nr:hypothetical protein QAD02_001471 [Eretmocerus hayati]